MLRQLRFAMFAAAALAGSAAAQADINLQNLLRALSEGREVTLLTPTAGGMVQVTSFTPPQPYTTSEAAALVEAARARLADLGVARPTGEQLATALVGGTVDVPSGRTELSRLLPGGTAPLPLHSQMIFASSLPQVVAPARQER